jgi:hypothetical protein
MSYQLTKLLVLTILLLTLPQTANAYWLESEPEPFSLREREHAPPTKGEMFFTIQDNFELFTDKIEPGPMLLPHSDYFVPADIIDINLPLFGIFSHPAKSAEDPIANLLYANLKIKKILDEYNEIQERAQKLLQDDSGNLSIGKMQVNANEENSGNLAKDDKEKKLSIYKELHQKLISLSTANLSDAPDPVATPDGAPEIQTAQAPVSVFSFLHLQKQTEGPLKTAKLTSYNSTESGKIATSENPAQTTSKYSQQQAQETSQQNQHSKYSGETSLPWLLDLPFKIFSYFLAHKIQALFILFFGLMIINILFGSRS